MVALKNQKRKGSAMGLQLLTQKDMDCHFHYQESKHTPLAALAAQLGMGLSGFGKARD